MTVPAEQVLAVSAVLFAIGLVGVLVRRNVVVVLLAVEVMLNAAVLGLVGFAVDGGGRLGAPASGAAGGIGGGWFALLVILVSVSQLAVALAVVAAWLRHRRSLDVDDASGLKW